MQEEKDKTRGSGLRRNMAEPELKSRSSRESVAKAASQEKMEGRYSACSHSCRYHMVQGCIIPPCALMQHCLMQKCSQMDVAVEMRHGVLCVVCGDR